MYKLELQYLQLLKAFRRLNKIVKQLLNQRKADNVQSLPIPKSI
jgi:hypothetical protein